MPNLRVTIQEFNKALTALNEKLANIDKTIEIKAIGGYAMMRAGLRDTEESPGFSEDIDSIAGRFSKQVIMLIEEVGEELDLLPDWLNTDPIDLPEVDEVKDQLTWIEDLSFSNIHLLIADIKSLILLKTRAIEGSGLIARKTDKNDLIKLLKHIGVADLKMLSQNVQTQFIKDYPRCYKYLEERGNW